MKLRIRKCWSAPSRSLYQKSKSINTTLCFTPPMNTLETIDTPWAITHRNLAWFEERRPDGNGRQGLFSPSSWMDFGFRWLPRVKINKLIHVQYSTVGVRSRIARVLGDELVLRTGPERALRRPKAVSGPTMDLRSLRVNSHKVYAWYDSEFDVLVQACFFHYLVILLGEPRLKSLYG